MFVKSQLEVFEKYNTVQLETYQSGFPRDCLLMETNGLFFFRILFLEIQFINRIDFTSIALNSDMNNNILYFLFID